MSLKSVSLTVAVVALAMAGGVGAATMAGKTPKAPAAATASRPEPGPSGLAVGQRMLAFETKHVTGPDKGTDTCPICKYGTLPGVMVFAHKADDDVLVQVADKLDKLVGASKYDLHAFVVVLTDDAKDVEAVRAMYGDKYKHLAVTHLPADDPVVKDYKVDLSGKTRTTAMIYKHMKVTKVLTNVGEEKGSLDALVEATKKVDSAG
ncbi:MAG: hypothetical protein KF857_01040 [Fimbriimonadaceae bacterium]|nr:hypothetical protein [Fimbriimonadaceae bacterium]